jgi:hypothetical protein
VIRIALAPAGRDFNDVLREDGFDEPDDLKAVLDLIDQAPASGTFAEPQARSELSAEDLRAAGLAAARPRRWRS